MVSRYSSELAFATELAHKAGDIMLKYFTVDQQQQTKGDGTPVTIADITINRLIIDEVAKYFNKDGVVGEEESTADYGMGRRWICDPVDGTAAFTYTVPTAMFSLALVIDGIPVVGVTYEPISKRLFHAARGYGSYCNDTRLAVSAATMNNGDIGLAPEFVSTKYLNEPFMQRLLAYGRTLAVFPGAVCRSSLVATGRLAGFPHPTVKPYDIAAAHIILEEAGGKITDIHGQTLDYSKSFRGAVLSNGVIHDDLLALFS